MPTRRDPTQIRRPGIRRKKPRELLGSGSWPDGEFSDYPAAVVAAFIGRLREVARLDGFATEDGEIRLRELSRRTGVNPATLSYMLNGESWPDMSLLARFEERLGRALWPGVTVGPRVSQLQNLNRLYWQEWIGVRDDPMTELHAVQMTPSARPVYVSGHVSSRLALCALEAADLAYEPHAAILGALQVADATRWNVALLTNKQPTRDLVGLFGEFSIGLIWRPSSDRGFRDSWEGGLTRQGQLPKTELRRPSLRGERSSVSDVFSGRPVKPIGKVVPVSSDLRNGEATG